MVNIILNRSTALTAWGWWSGYGSGWGSRYGGMSQNVVQSGPAGGIPEGPTTPGQIAITARVSAIFDLAD